MIDASSARVRASFLVIARETQRIATGPAELALEGRVGPAVRGGWLDGRDWGATARARA
jgi:hypothetical protein